MPTPNKITITSPKTNLKSTKNQHKKIKEQPPLQDSNKHIKLKSFKSQKGVSKPTNTPNYKTKSKQLDKHITKHNPITKPKFPTLNPPTITTLYTNTTPQKKNIIDGPKKNSLTLKRQKTNENTSTMLRNIPTQTRQKTKQNNPKQNKYTSKNLKNTQIPNLKNNNKNNKHKTLNTLDQIEHKIKNKTICTTSIRPKSNIQNKQKKRIKITKKHLQKTKNLNKKPKPYKKQKTKKNKQIHHTTPIKHQNTTLPHPFQNTYQNTKTKKRTQNILKPPTALKTK